MFTQACVYLDTARRLTVYPEGGYAVSRRVPDIGWCLPADEQPVCTDAELAAAFLADRAAGIPRHDDAGRYL